MKPSIAATIRALQAMSVFDLQAKYREVFGEDTRSRHRTYLWRRIAWRIQALEEGGLSERARRRAAELANEADVRIRPPRGAFEENPAPAYDPPPVSRGGRDPRLPAPGTLITRAYRGQAIRVTVLERGFEYEGRVYRSLTAVVGEVTGSHWNGFQFFRLTQGRSTPRRRCP
ncbi:MAG: DUF2924 domain-containing protein [Deltaproteobacteria bacterium]|nr:DUF2924 domain-containing protein [Deltaproteobacteria bacterium]